LRSTKKSSERLSKNTCSTNWNHHQKTLYNNATAIEVPKDVHQAGPTYGGKNTLSQVKQDAINLCGAECRDTDALRKNMLDRGYDPKLIDDAIRQLKERNTQTGVTK